MRDLEFADWLSTVDGRDKRQTSDNVSRARRIEEALSDYLGSEVNLDSEYHKDKCARILDMLSIDYAFRIPISINLPKDRIGLSSLRTAVKKYIRFCSKG